jgi:NitT/TauT family transport system substrate-binding protein
MQIRVALPDLVSNSYFPAIAAVELGFFKKEGLDAIHELIFPVPKCFQALRDGRTEFVAGSAHAPLWAFPRWQGAKVLCSLSQGMYWFLVVDKNNPIEKGDLQGLRGLRIGAAPGVDIGLRQLLNAAGIDPERDEIEIGLPPGGVPEGTSFGVAAAEWLREGIIDGFWANGMGTEVAVTDGIAKVILDVRRGDGPSEAFRFTQPALVTTQKLVGESPELAAAAIRAIVNTQKALKEDTELATHVGLKLFPEKEAKLIATLIKRDLPFYNPNIPEELIDGMNGFAHRAGLLEGGPVSYNDIVATDFIDLWES